VQTSTLLAFTVSHVRMRTWHELAVECARAANPPAGVGGTVGPAGHEPRDYWLLLESLLDLGVDAMSISSLYTRAHASAAITAALEVVRGSGSDMPVTISLSVSPARGALRNDWITKLDLPDGMTMGLNCCEGPGNLLPVAEVMADKYGPLHLGPSAGLPARDGTYPYDAEAWVEALAQVTEQVPVASIGACCGCTPDYVEQVRSRIDDQA